MAGESLTHFISQLSGDGHLRVEADLGDGFVRLRSAEAERRQAIQDIRCSEDIVIELLRNARDAGAHSIFLASSKSGNTRRLVVIDDGCGIPPSMHSHIFEPRVTSKLDSMRLDNWGVHGRGMALYSIAANANNAYVAESAKGKGSAIVVESDTTKLKEKADQSSFPVFILGSDNKVAVRGPKNILRTACEFALESRKECNVYVGSEAEIAASIYRQGLTNRDVCSITFQDNLDTLPIVERFCCADDIKEFNQVSAASGLQTSERTTRRILDGDIMPVRPILSYVKLQDENGRNVNTSALNETELPHTTNTLTKPHTPRINNTDREVFAQAVQEAFKDLANSYYLDANVAADISVKSGRLHVSIPLNPLD